MSSSKRKKYFVVCINNRGYSASLEKGKIYRAEQDEKAAKLGLVRVRDESGSSYLYPAKHFTALELPAAVARALARAA